MKRSRCIIFLVLFLILSPVTFAATAIEYGLIASERSLAIIAALGQLPQAVICSKAKTLQSGGSLVYENTTVVASNTSNQYGVAWLSQVQLPSKSTSKGTPVSTILTGAVMKCNSFSLSQVTPVTQVGTTPLEEATKMAAQ